MQRSIGPIPRGCSVIPSPRIRLSDVALTNRAHSLFDVPNAQIQFSRDLRGGVLFEPHLENLAEHGVLKGVEEAVDFQLANNQVMGWWEIGINPIEGILAELVTLPGAMSPPLHRPATDLPIGPESLRAATWRPGIADCGA